MRADLKGVVVLLMAVACVSGGCAEPNQRLNAPPQGAPVAESQLRDNFIAMTDNAMLYDLCVADIHFVPHTAELNGLGVKRLTRYGELLDPAGGTIHLEAADPEDELTAARIKSIGEFLASTGLEAGCVKVEVGLPQGRPTDAMDAIRIWKQGTAPPTNQPPAAAGAAAPTGSSPTK
jgi:hypothetical protein